VDRRIRFGRIRSGKKKRHPKSVLITQRIDNEIFFGISNCNLSQDKWSRDEGVDRATERLELALRLPKQAFTESGLCAGVQAHPKRFLGYCDVKNAVRMIKYFQLVTCSR